MKFLIALSFKNIFRNKRRTFLTILALFFATMMIVLFKSFNEGMFNNLQANARIMETGDIKIAHKQYFKKQRTIPLEYHIENCEDVINEIKQIEGVKHIAPRIKFPVILNVNDKNYTIFVMGIDPDVEKQFNPLHEKIIDGKYLNPLENELLVGRISAEKLNLNINQKLTLLSETVYSSISVKSFIIKVIFSYGVTFFDKKLFFIPIKYARKLVKMKGGASEILIFLDKKKDPDKIAEIINKNLPKEYIAKSWTKQGFIYNMIRIADAMYNWIYFFFVLLAAFVIINTIMMSVYERFREIGTLTAMVMRKKEVVLLFVFESGILSLIGSFLGASTGGLLSLLFSRYGIDVSKMGAEALEEFTISNIIYFQPDIYTVIFSFILGFAISVICAAIPARKAAKVDPIKALRTV